MSATAARPAIAAATFERVARAILAGNGAGKDPHPSLVEDTARELAYAYETTGALPTAHRSRLQVTTHGLEFWACSCGRTGNPTSRARAGNGQAKHVDAARRAEGVRAELEVAR